MIDKSARPWVIAVLLAYIALAIVVILLVRSPWNWLLSILVIGKGAGFYALIRKVSMLGVRPMPRQTAAREAIHTAKSET